MNGKMEHGTTEYMGQIIVGLADLVRDVRMHGRTARFDMRAPGLLEEAMAALQELTAAERGGVMQQRKAA